MRLKLTSEIQHDNNEYSWILFVNFIKIPNYNQLILRTPHTISLVLMIYKNHHYIHHIQKWVTPTG